MTREINTNHSKRGMRGEMLMYLSVFAAIVLVVIWILQIVLLDDIYSFIKKQQIESAARTISAKINNDDLETVVYDIANEHNTCISVYEVRGNIATPSVNAHIQGMCKIHTANAETYLGTLYSKARDTRVYTEIEPADAGAPSDTMICARIIEGENCNYLIALNSEIEPVGATVTTLRYIIVAITVVLIIVSVIMSYVISRRFTRPVIEMNVEAKKLAVGNYDVDFRGEEFLETAELAATLNYATDELSKMDRMQKELIANISHDLRTPLTTILGFSEVMRDIPGENTPENMQVIIDETRHLSDLVSDMLDVSKITGGQRPLTPTRFSLAEAISTTLERYNALRERDGYRFIFNCESEVTVEADKTLIMQVVYNLINNAVNYTGEDKTVTVTLTEQDGIARVSVTDTGEGIAPEKLPLIWDRYYKVGDYHKRGVCGTGLGLSIVKNALILHGADFGVSSTVGIGSTFWFELRKVTAD